ncbi:hypothetical protein [Devosia sp. A449]
MSDNVVKFRPIEKKPDPQQPKKEPGVPGWVPWVGLVVVGVVIYGLQQAGMLGA